MPIYEYQCAEDHVTEKIQSIHASNMIQCPVCQKQAKRIPSRSNWKFGSLEDKGGIRVETKKIGDW